MAKKKQGMYLLLAAAGVGVFIYTRKKEKEKAAVKEIVKGAVMMAKTEQAIQGYFSVG